MRRSGRRAARSGAVYDQGLRAYMLGIYNHMTLALAISGACRAWRVHARVTTILGVNGHGLTLTALRAGCSM